MADGPLTGMTFEDMIVDCATRWGCADESGDTPGVPDNTPNLVKVKDKINAGYRNFLTENPKWTFLERQVQVQAYPAGDGPDNIEGDAGRYRLPRYVGSTPRNDWHFIGASRPRTTVPNWAIDLIRKRRALYSRQTGIPTLAGCGPIEQGNRPSQEQGGWEVMFWPAPSLEYLMETTFRIDAHELVDLGERHIAGNAHDRTILAYADWEWYRDDAEDPQLRQVYYTALNGDPVAGTEGMKQRSFRLDNEHRSRMRGSISLERNRFRDRRPTHRYLGRVTFDGSFVNPAQ